MNEAEAVQPPRLWRRVAARLVDNVVVLALMGAYACVTVGAPFLLFVREAGGDFLTDRQSSVDSFLFVVYAVAFVLAPVGLLAVFFVYEVVTTRRRGQTFGKRLLGLRVVSRDDAASAPLEYWRSVTRWVVLQVVPLMIGSAVATIRLVSGVRIDWTMEAARVAAIGATCAVAISLPAVITRSRRGVHDWAAGTVVVRASHGSERPQRRGWGGEGFDRWQGSVRGVGPVSGSGL